MDGEAGQDFIVKQTDAPHSLKGSGNCKRANAYAY
jgi:hypothetical protein